MVTATTFEELVEFAESTDPLIIQVCGALGSGGNERINLGSNKTLVGVGVRPTLQSTLNLSGVQNVIVRNLFVRVIDPTPLDTAEDLRDDTSVDGISVRRSNHVWLDHLDIANSTDGNLDITEQSDYVTVSWTRFWYPTQAQRDAHRFSNLIGSSDTNPADMGTLKVTMHHNWWGDRVRERMPRTRYGDIHIFNNLYTSDDANYCVRAGVQSRMLVEGNYFLGVSEPIDLDGGSVLEQNNVFDRVQDLVPGVGPGFEPLYDYTLDEATELPRMIAEGAGAVLPFD
jgi:pectate lyase